MNEQIFNKIKKTSANAKLDPPTRVWNRLEYKLDRIDLEREKNWTSKIIYATSIAAVFIVIIVSISVLKKNDKVQLSVNDQSTLIIEDFQDENVIYQAYNVHELQNSYSKIQGNKTEYKLKNLKVNFNPKG